MDAPVSAGRAREPDQSGFVMQGGVRIAYESYGEGERTLLFLPSWAIVNQRQWKAQVPYFARHCRVVTFDPRGNGARTARTMSTPTASVSSRTTHWPCWIDLGIERAAFVSLSAGAVPSLIVAADHPQRVSALAFIGPAVPFAFSEERKTGFDAILPAYEGWDRRQPQRLAARLPGFCEFFFEQILPEPHSTRQIESGVEWGAGTTAETLIKTIDAAVLHEPETRALTRRVRCPVLVIHGVEDAIRHLPRASPWRSRRPVRLVTLEGSGHSPNLRDPVRVNHLLREFLLPPSPPASWRRAPGRPQRALFVSSPIGLGHARRDLAIARELRRLRPRAGDRVAGPVADDRVTRGKRRADPCSE